MKLLFRRAVTYVCTSALAVSLFAFAGCSGNTGDNNAAQSTEAASEETQPKTEEPMTIKFYTGSVLKEGSPIVEAAEKALNVKFQFYQEDEDAYKLLLAAGDYPDVRVLPQPASVQDYVNQGLLREIPMDLINNNAPGFVKIINELSPNAWEAFKVGDKLYGLPIVTYDTQGANIGVTRQDWLDNIGMGDIGNEITFEQLEDMFYKFVNNDPDKNNIKDTHAISKAWELDGQLASIIGAYRVMVEAGYGSGWVNVDDQVVYSPTAPQYKDVLKILQKWYKDGIIDPEFLNETPATLTEKFATGKIGYVTGGMPNLIPDNDTMSSLRPVVEFYKANPEGKKVHFISKVTGSNGKAYAKTNFPMIGWSYVFFDGVSDQKVADILKVLDKPVNDIELYKLIVFGRDGEDYYVADDGTIKTTEEQKNAKLKLQQEYGVYSTGITPPRDKERSKLFYGSWLEDFFKLPMPEALNIPFAKGWPSSEASKKLPDLYKVASEFTLNAIIGKADIDKEWDGFVKSLESYGIDELTKEYNECYKNSK